MATMIAAVTTTAVFSVVLSSFVSISRADKRDAAAMAVRNAQEVLKGYVSAVPGEAAYVPNNGRWNADGAAWALSQGNHNIDSLVNAANSPVLSPAGSPVATFRYTVTDRNCGFGFGALACKQVVFTLSYTD